MKLIFIFIISCVSISLFSQVADVSHRLNKLYHDKQFFKMRDEFSKESNKLEDAEKEYFQSLLYSIFNRPVESNIIIEKLLKENKNIFNDSMEVELYKSKLINSVNLFLYDDAMKTTEIILSEYENLIGKDDIEDFQNSDLIWKASSKLDPQTVTVSGDTRLTSKKDMAGLTNIKVNINGNEEDFIFDTGANISTVTDSYSKKLGLKILEGSLEVGTSTDKEVISSLAYADSLKIGKLNFKNVLFLVLPDEALTFGGGVYVINGIIGFPVIKEMKEISVSKDEIYIPLNRNQSTYKNLALDGFLPLIETIVNTDTLVFSFDTGAKKTAIYYPYYAKYKSIIDSSYELEDVKIGGAGGEIIVKGFRLKDVSFQIATAETVLNDISLFSKPIKDEDEYLYGNLGGDFIHRFKKMIINFENMYVEFEN